MEEEDAAFVKKNIMRPDLVQPDTVPMAVPEFPSNPSKLEPAPKPKPTISGETSQAKVVYKNVQSIMY